VSGAGGGPGTGSVAAADAPGRSLDDRKAAIRAVLGQLADAADVAGLDSVARDVRQVRIPKLDAQMKSGLYRPDSSRSLEETASITGEVMAMGEDAYRDPEKFPGGPWCQPGDMIMPGGQTVNIRQMMMGQQKG